MKKVEKGLKTANLLSLSPTLFQLKSPPFNTSKALLPRATLVQEEVNPSIRHFTVTGAITEFRVGFVTIWAVAQFSLPVRAQGDVKHAGCFFKHLLPG